MPKGKGIVNNYSLLCEDLRVIANQLIEVEKKLISTNNKEEVQNLRKLYSELYEIYKFRGIENSKVNFSMDDEAIKNSENIQNRINILENVIQRIDIFGKYEVEEQNINESNIEVLNYYWKQLDRKLLVDSRDSVLECSSADEPIVGKAFEGKNVSENQDIIDYSESSFMNSAQRNNVPIGIDACKKKLNEILIEATNVRDRWAEKFDSNGKITEEFRDKFFRLNYYIDDIEKEMEEIHDVQNLDELYEFLTKEATESKLWWPHLIEQEAPNLFKLIREFKDLRAMTYGYYKEKGIGVKLLKVAHNSTYKPFREIVNMIYDKASIGNTAFNIFPKKRKIPDNDLQVETSSINNKRIK